MNSSREITLGALMSYAAVIFNISAGLIYTPWMIQKIGRADYGLFALAVSFLAYFMLDFGFGHAIARFLAKYRAEGREERIRELLGLTAKVFLLLDFGFLLVIVTLFFFIETVFVSLSPEEIQKFRVVYCVVGFFSIVSFPFLPLTSVLIGYERFVFLKFCDLLKKVLTIGLMVLALLAGYGLYALVTVNALVGIVIIVFQCAYLFWNTSVQIDIFNFDRGLLKEIVQYSVWVAVILFAQRLFLNITPAILGVFSGTSEIAVFSIGMTIEAYFYSFAAALGGLFLPKVSRMMAVEDHAGISRLMIRVGRIQLLVMGSIAAGLITIGRQFVVLWIGTSFTSSYFVALLLILPGLITFSQQVAYTVVAVENKLRYHAIVLLCGAPLSIGVSAALSPRFGAIGAAIGVCLASLLCSIAMTIVFYRVMHLDMRRFFSDCHMKMLPPFLLALGAGFVVNRWVPAVSLVAFIPKAVLLAGLCALIMWALVMNAEEKQLARSVARRIPGIGKVL